MIVLDTNLISELISGTPDKRVLEWAATLPAQSLYLSSITVAEMRYGVEIMTEGKRRTALEKSINALPYHKSVLTIIQDCDSISPS